MYVMRLVPNVELNNLATLLPPVKVFFSSLEQQEAAWSGMPPENQKKKKIAAGDAHKFRIQSAYERFAYLFDIDRCLLGCVYDSGQGEGHSL